MKKLLAILAGLTIAGAAVSCFADAAVSANNYDINHPIFYLDEKTMLPMEGSFVQVFGGADIGSLKAITPALNLTEDGMFDGGKAVIAGLADDSQAAFRVQAWKGAATFDAAPARGDSGVFSQKTGSSPAPPAVPKPAVLEMPSFTVVVPEPSTLALVLLGAGALLIRRRK